MYCSVCGNEMQREHNFCSSCGSAKEQDGNSISSGDNSINTIGSEITDSTIHVGNYYSNSNNIDPAILNLKRHFVSLPWSSEGKVANRSSILKLGTWGSIASIVGLFLPYFTEMDYQPHFFMFGFGLFMSLLMLSFILKKFKFTHFFGLMNFEAGTKDGAYLTKITCDCPWCGFEMKLRMVGPKNHKEHMLLCERNPSQHKIIFDSTAMPDIEE